MTILNCMFMIEFVLRKVGESQRPGVNCRYLEKGRKENGTTKGVSGAARENEHGEHVHLVMTIYKQIIALFHSYQSLLGAQQCLARRP